MTKTTPKLLAALKAVHHERANILKALLKTDELALGSVSTVQRKCGKSTCYCAKEGGHPQTLFLFKGLDGKRRCKLIRQSDVERVMAAGENYRQCREQLRRLGPLNQREKEILVALVEARGLDYE